MTEKRTKVILEAQARGFSQAAKDAKQLQQAASVPKDATKTIEAVDKAASRSSRSLRELNRLLKDKDGASSLRALRGEVEKLGKAFDTLGEKRRNVHRGGREMNFSRGLVQGLGIGEYFPERTRAGFASNVAGRLVGGGMRGIGQGAMGFGSMPFTGAAGLAAGLSSIPFVGGVLAGAAGQGISAAQTAVQLQQQRAQMSMFAGGAGIAGASRAELAAARRRAEAQNPIPSLRVESINQRIAREAEWQSGYAGKTGTGRDAGYGRAGGFGPPTHDTQLPGGLDAGFGPPMSGGDEAAGPAAALEAEHRSIVRNNAAERKAAEERRQAAIKRAEAEIRSRTPLGFTRAQGEKFGLTEQQALQALQGFLGASGTDLNALGRPGQSRDLLRAGMGAQARFGVDPSVAGSFLRTTESGAMGAGVDANEAFRQAVQGGVALGLRGADLTRHMQEMAQRIANFDETGIPVAMESLHALQQGLAGSLGSMRGSAVAAQLMERFQGLATRGPSNAAESMALRHLGGYQGGGAGDYFDALKMMEAGGKEGGFESLLRSVQTFGTAKENALSVMGLGTQLGLNFQPSEAERLVGGDSALSRQFQGRLARGRKDAAGVTDLGAMGEAVQPAASKSLAAVQNELADAGAKLVPSLISMEKATTQMVTNFATFSKEINALTGWAQETSKTVGGLVQRARGVVDAMETKLGLLQSQ